MHDTIIKTSFIHSHHTERAKCYNTCKMISGYILVLDPLYVHWEQIRCEHVSSFDCLQTYTARAERELGAKHKKTRHISASTVFIRGRVNRKVTFSPTQSSRSYLDKLPIEVGDDCITLLCCVHPDRGEDKTMIHRPITQRRSTVKHKVRL